MRSLLALALVLLPAGPTAAQDAATAARDESAAVRALEMARASVARKAMRKAWDELAKLRGPMRGTKVVATHRDEIDRLRLEAGLEVVGGAAGFRGEVEALRGGDLRLVYDFRQAPASLEDFEDVMTVSAAVRRRGPILNGIGSVCHRAPFTGDVRIEIEGIALSNEDLGLVVVDRDSEKPRFLVAALANTFFGVKYDAERSITPGHLLVFCGPGAESRARENPSQILAQRPSKPGELETDSEVHMVLALKNRQAHLTAGTVSLAAGLSAAQDIPRRHVGLHLHRSAFRIQRVVIEGRLDPVWSREEVDRLRARLR